MILSLSAAVGTIVSVAVGVLAVGIVEFTLIYSYVRKKQGKSGCDCGCDCCSCKSACHSNEKKPDDKPKP